MKLKRIYLKTMVKDNLTAIEWKDKWNVNVLMNMHSPPLEGNFCDEQGKAVKPAIIHNCNRLMGYVDECDHTLLLADRPGNGQRICSSIFWTLPFSTNLSFLPLVEIITLTIQTHISRWSNTQGSKGALTSCCETNKTNTIHEPTKNTWLKIQQTLVYAVSEHFVPCVFCQKQRNKNKIQMSRIQHRVVCYQMFWSISPKLQFWEPAGTKMEKQNTQLSVNITIVITELICSSSIFCWNNGLKGCGVYRRSFMKKQRLVCVYYEETIRTTAWRHLWIICNYWKNRRVDSKKN